MVEKTWQKENNYVTRPEEVSAIRDNSSSVKSKKEEIASD